MPDTPRFKWLDLWATESKLIDIETGIEFGHVQAVYDGYAPRVRVYMEDHYRDRTIASPLCRSMQEAKQRVESVASGHVKLIDIA